MELFAILLLSAGILAPHGVVDAAPASACAAAPAQSQPKREIIVTSLLQSARLHSSLAHAVDDAEPSTTAPALERRGGQQQTIRRPSETPMGQSPAFAITGIRHEVIVTAAKVAEGNHTFGRILLEKSRHAAATSTVPLVILMVILVVGCACWFQVNVENTKTVSSDEVSNSVFHEDADDISAEPQEFDADVFGCTTAAFVRDMHFLSKDHASNNHIRVRRMATTFLLLILLVILQAFLLLQIRQYVTARAVRDMRLAYDEFETHMYNRNDLVITENGFHRGINSTGFHPERFANLTELTKKVVCRIPFSHPQFIYVIVFIWSLTVVYEFQHMGTWWYCLIWRTRTYGMFLDGMQNCFDGRRTSSFLEDDDPAVRGNKVIYSLTYMVKGILIVFVGLPRAAITLCLLWLGCRWLIATVDFTDLIMNTVALEFILLLKKLIYKTVVPARIKTEQECTLMLPAQERFTVSDEQVLFTCFLLFVTAVWTYLYLFHLQTVLPMYQWDVRKVCWEWVKQRYALQNSGAIHSLGGLAGAG